MGLTRSGKSCQSRASLQLGGGRMLRDERGPEEGRKKERKVKKRKEKKRKMRPQSYSCKDLNSDKNLNDPERGPSPGKPGFQIKASLANTLISASRDPKQRTPLSWISDLQNCEIIKGCCVKLLNLWPFIMHHRKRIWSLSHSHLREGPSMVTSESILLDNISVLLTLPCCLQSL